MTATFPDNRMNNLRFAVMYYNGDELVTRAVPENQRPGDYAAWLADRFDTQVSVLGSFYIREPSSVTRPAPFPERVNPSPYESNREAFRGSLERLGD